MKFSQRYGYKPIRETIQIDSMDEALRNGIWNVLKLLCWNKVYSSTRDLRGGAYLDSYGNEKIKELCLNLWLAYFKKTLDTLSNDWSVVYDEINTYFFNCEWHEVYDFIEFVSKHYEMEDFKDNFVSACNIILEQEMSAYRFVDGVITRITGEQEITEIEQAIEDSDEPVRTHLKRSLEMLSDREKRDYRNSIKESISAVESLVSVTLKEEHGTFKQLMKKLEDEIGLHSALRTAFNNLYGYSSDEGGIRHALTEGSSFVDFNDAKFMLVACSAFINFVKGKVANKG